MKNVKKPTTLTPKINRVERVFTNEVEIEVPTVSKIVDESKDNLHEIRTDLNEIKQILNELNENIVKLYKSLPFNK